MNDEDALLRAIVESPDDLALRMVYADWCEEHGRAERAALIRGQCFLDPVLSPPPASYSPYHNDARFLRAQHLTPLLRESVLSPFRPFADAARIEWDGPDGFASAESHWYSVRRGFVESHSLTSLRQLASWLPHAAGILARLPVQALRLHRSWAERRPEQDPPHLPADHLAGLLAVEGIERVRELRMVEFNLGPAAADTLLRLGDKLRLSTLAVRYRTLPRATRGALVARFGTALDIARAPSDEDIPF